MRRDPSAGPLAAALSALLLLTSSLEARAEDDPHAAPPRAAVPEATSPTRVLLITVDTLRADHVGAYGGPVPTPAMDRLAREGVLVEQACTPMPTTAPAHASLFTGLHPWSHGVIENAMALDPGVATLAEALSERGVATAAFVSSYILHPRFGLARGFETYWFEPDQAYPYSQTHADKFWSRGEATTRAAMQWLTTHGRSSFFVWVHYFDPHAPYRPPIGFGVSPQSPVDLTNKQVPKELKNRSELERSIRAYRGEVRYVDAQVGKLVERLVLLGLLDSTTVVLTSDHGEGLGDHGHLQHGQNLFEELIHIPLIVRGPGVPAGRRVAGEAQLEDLAPTISSLYGAALPPPIDGVDLGSWLRGEVERSPRTTAVGRRRRLQQTPDLFYQRRWPEKWIGRIGRPGYTLNLEQNPTEVMSEPASGVPEHLLQSIERAPRSAPQVLPNDPDPEVLRALRALGYLEE